jgi:hypothetical protein
MNDEALNLSIRQFLKMVGVNSQREIEKAVSAAFATKTLRGSEKLPATMTLRIADLDLEVKFDGEIRLS